MKNQKKLSKKELKRINGGYVPIENGGGGGDGCYVNWIVCPGNGPARVVGPNQGLKCC